MFILDLDPVFTWPVTVRMPNEGGFRESTFAARFRLLNEVDRDTLIVEGGDTGLLRRALIGFDDVETPDGKPFDNSAESLAAALNLQPIRVALADAYAAAVYGAAPSAAARGN